MSMLKYLAPVLAVAGSVAAQCSVTATTTIQNSGDATKLASCSTFSGSIAVATGTSDSIILSGIERIRGSLVINNASSITSFNAPDLEIIEDTFEVTNNQILESMSFPKLTELDTLHFEGLPNLATVLFTTGIQKAETIDIRNTFLSSLEGIQSVKGVNLFYLANNKFLNAVSLELGNITTSLTLEDNGDQMLATFPNLEWANNMTFRNCPNVSVPALVSTNGSLGFYENTLTSLSANNLTTVGGSLSIVTNTKLSELELPALKSVGGGLQIANNTALEAIKLAKLETVTGALDFYGNFTTVELPALKDIKGAFNIQSSSSDISDECAAFKKISGSTSVIKGKFVCAGAVANPSGQGTTPTSTATGSASSATKSGAAISSLDISAMQVMGFSGLIAAMLGLL